MVGQSSVSHALLDPRAQGPVSDEHEARPRSEAEQLAEDVKKEPVVLLLAEASYVPHYRAVPQTERTPNLDAGLTIETVGTHVDSVREHLETATAEHELTSSVRACQARVRVGSNIAAYDPVAQAAQPRVGVGGRVGVDGEGTYPVAMSHRIEEAREDGVVQVRHGILPRMLIQHLAQG